MQIHGPSVIVTDLDVYLNQAGPQPFAVIRFGADVHMSLSNVGDCDRLIKAALKAKDLLVGVTQEREIAEAKPSAPICGSRKPGINGVECQRSAGHAGGHKNLAKDEYWPQDEEG